MRADTPDPGWDGAQNGELAGHPGHLMRSHKGPPKPTGRNDINPKSWQKRHGGCVKGVPGGDPGPGLDSFAPKDLGPTTELFFLHWRRERSKLAGLPERNQAVVPGHIKVLVTVQRKGPAKF